MIQHISKSKKTKKSKRPKHEQYTKNKKGRKQPPKNGSHGKINRTLTFHGKRLCKILFRSRRFVRHLEIYNEFL